MRFNWISKGFATVLCTLGLMTPGLSFGGGIFEEVYNIVLTNVPWVNRSQLDAKAAEGLVHALNPYVKWVTTREWDTVDSSSYRTEVLPDGIFRVWFGQIRPDVVRVISREFARITTQTNIIGVVLDLRFSGGDYYDQLGHVIGLFHRRPIELLRLGDVTITNVPASVEFRAPLVVLVNRETRGAAEVLAALVRELGMGLLVGSKSAGEAFEWREFSLSDGRQLKVAVGEIQVGNKKLSGGVLPDIEVNVDLSEERTLFVKPIEIVDVGNNAGGARNDSEGAFRQRLNEAELERLHSEGIANRYESSSESRSKEGMKVVVIKDPALSRAVDLLKALYVLKR